MASEESFLDTKFRTYIEQQLDNRSIRVLDSFRVTRRVANHNIHEYDCLTISDAKFYITDKNTQFLKIKLNVKYEEVKQTSVGPDGKWVIKHSSRMVDNEHYSIENIIRNDDPLYKEKIDEILDQYKKEYWDMMAGLRRTV
jgi:hypothetical protein